MQEAEPLQQVRRTYVRYRGKTLSYFGGCDYFRFASHPKIHRAVQVGLQRYGLNVAASRLTTGNHQLYGQLETALAKFFHAPAALLISTGYATNLIAAQALAGQFSHALIDERAHAALQDAANALDCPILRFKHRELEDFIRALARCGKSSRPIVLTDGMFSRDGSIAPLRAYLRALPRDGCILVDDAHAVGTAGATGRGSIEFEGVSRTRLIQCLTLSKALGVYGGAIICDAKLRQKLVRTRAFIGSTPLPLPLINASLAALNLFKASKTFLPRLHHNASFLRAALVRSGYEIPNTPGPIVALYFRQKTDMNRVCRSLLSYQILPPLIRYLDSQSIGYFRFVISSEHSRAQLTRLVEALSPFSQCV